MTGDAPLIRRSSLAWGAALVLGCIALCVLIGWQPQQLRAPAWVAYAAAAAFGMAGLILLAGAAGAARLQNWLAVALVLALVLPGLWVAFGAGERTCTVSLPFLQFASDAVCRGTFGFGAALGLGILTLYVRHAIVRQPKG